MNQPQRHKGTWCPRRYLAQEPLARGIGRPDNGLRRGSLPRVEHGGCRLEGNRGEACFLSGLRQEFALLNEAACRYTIPLLVRGVRPDRRRKCEASDQSTALRPGQDLFHLG